MLILDVIGHMSAPQIRDVLGDRRDMIQASDDRTEASE